MWNIPNQLTLLRIGMIPVFVILYYLPWGWSHIASATIFGLAALTDWVDGYLGLYASAGIALWSMVVYLKQAWPEMTGADKAESD